jgi:small subunit ribosomal protein S17
MMNETSADRGRVMTGRAVRATLSKSVVIELARQVRHPKYHKYIRRRTRIMAHDESGAVKAGDLVRIRECRPFSNRKSWSVEAVIGHEGITEGDQS